MNYSIIHKKNTCIISLTLTLSSDVPEKIRLNCQKPLTNHDPNSRNDSTTVQSSLAWLSYSCMSIYVYCIHQFNNCWDLRLFLCCVIMNIILSERSLLVDLWISSSPWLLSSLALSARIICGLVTFAFVTKRALMIHTETVHPSPLTVLPGERMQLKDFLKATWFASAAE